MPHVFYVKAILNNRVVFALFLNTSVIQLTLLKDLATRNRRRRLLLEKRFVRDNLRVTGFGTRGLAHQESSHL